MNDTFAHNTRSELVEAQLNGSDYEYAYDNIGNRQFALEDNTATMYDTNALNQYTAIAENGATAFVPQFDADGNQTLIKTSTGIWSAVYNAANRPVSFTNTESNTVVECAYDSQGRRAYKKVTVDGNVTLHQRYIYRGYLQIACCDLTRSHHPVMWLVTWDPTQPVATRPLSIRINGTWYTYGWDLTKNICELYSTGGTLTTAYTYTPYGSVTATGAVTQPIQWSSEVWDIETSLNYYNWRYYNPVLTWINRDFIKNKYSYNLYIHSHNSPAMIYDILGNYYDVDMSNCLGYALMGRSIFLQPDNNQSMENFVAFYVQAKSCKKIKTSAHCTKSKHNTKVLIIFYTGNYTGDPWKRPQIWGTGERDYHGMRLVAGNDTWTNIPHKFYYNSLPTIADPVRFDGCTMYCCNAKEEYKYDEFYGHERR